MERGFARDGPPPHRLSPFRRRFVPAPPRRGTPIASFARSIKIENRIETELIWRLNRRAMREKDVSRLLTDEYAERILVATQDVPRSVQEISDRYDIPIAACYRKIR